MNCPTCKSEDTQSIRMVVDTGTTVNAPPLRIGVPQAKTGLAAKLDPGPRPSMLTSHGGAGALGIIGCSGLLFAPFFTWVYLAVGNLSPLWILMIVGFLLMGLWAFPMALKKSREEIKEWEEKKVFAESMWVCLRCGGTFDPTGAAPK